MPVKKKKATDESFPHSLNIRMSGKTKRKLGRLARNINGNTTDVFCISLALLEVCVAAQKKGSRLVIISANGRKKTIIALIRKKRQTRKG